MKQHKHILLYDDKGKLECTITNTGLGYQVMMLHTLLGIYQTEEQAIDAYNMKKLNDTEYASFQKRTTITIVISSIIAFIALVIILSCTSYAPAINEFFIN